MSVCAHADTHLHIFISAFVCILKTLSTHQCFQCQSDTAWFIHVSSLFIFVTSFSDGEKAASRYL